MSVEVLPYPPDSPLTLVSAAAAGTRLSSWAQELAAEVARDADRLAAAWDGPAAAACRHELERVAALTRAVAGPLQTGARLLRAHAATVEGACAEVDRLRREHAALLAEHRRELAAVLAMPDVPGPLRRLQAQDTRDVQLGELGRLHARHRAVLDRVAEDASRTARQVSAAARDLLPVAARAMNVPPPPGTAGAQEGALASLLPLLAASRRAVGAHGSPPPAGTPAVLVRAWWQALTGDEQQRLATTWPVEIGGLDGLPGAVRSAANEQRLAQDLARLRATGTLDAAEQRRLDNCVVVRDQLATVRSQADPVTRDPLTAQLLVFDPSAYDGEGRAAIAVGDVDSAGHVAFLVPGLGSDVRGAVAALTDNAVRVTTEARRAAPEHATATVAWMGYDAPGLGDVVFDGAAEEGADLLAADVLAVQAARDVAPHLTVVGHSYGSTTTGTALRDHVTGVDDAVLVGSPGPNVEDASDLVLPDGHVFVGASSRDPVSYVDRFGKDPTHESFGAVRFRAEDPTRNEFMLDIADHSKYFDTKSESLANIVAVVVGDYAGVTTAAYRDEVWLLPDGINDDPEADREPTVVP
ncbi:MAG TPA: alpha/beta hydrolase [Actinomycetes bacterium]